MKKSMAKWPVCASQLSCWAESFDRKHLLVGECKWQEHVDADGELERLKTIASGLPFAREHQLHFELFLKEKPGNRLDFNTFCPDDVMTMHI